MALKKLCRCGKIINCDQKFCKECQEKYKQEKVESNRYYDKYIRDKRVVAFYKSQEWIKTRKYILVKYKGLDLYAFFILKKIVYADTVHHIVELKEDWSRRLEIGNLFPLSNSNHNKIHGMCDRDKDSTQELLRGLLQRWNSEYEG